MPLLESVVPTGYPLVERSGIFRQVFGVRQQFKVYNRIK